LTAASDGSYSLTVDLQASRDSDDPGQRALARFESYVGYF